MQIFKVKGQKRSNFEKLLIFYILYYEGPNKTTEVVINILY